MRAELAAAGLCVLTAVIGVRYIETRQEAADAAAALAARPAARVAQQTTGPGAYRTSWRREVVLRAGPDRQFRVSAGVNRRSMNFLVDTGAAFVALRESDARRARIYVTRSDFTSPVSTANGVTKAARVRVDSIEIDGLLVRDVDAFVLPDDKLGMNLLGMSYLSQIKSVEARGEEMILRG
ncbi:MAG: TIGR02281 family clan AA aspartic protease [Pseudomonadota bacterium]